MLYCKIIVWILSVILVKGATLKIMILSASDICIISYIVVYTFQIIPIIIVTNRYIILIT